MNPEPTLLLHRAKVLPILPVWNHIRVSCACQASMGGKPGQSQVGLIPGKTGQNMIQDAVVLPRSVAPGVVPVDERVKRKWAKGHQVRAGSPL